MNRKRQLAAAFLLSILDVSTAWSQTPASKPSVGRIIGNIDGISQDGDHYLLSGWACQRQLEVIAATTGLFGLIIPPDA